MRGPLACSATTAVGCDYAAVNLPPQPGPRPSPGSPPKRPHHPSPLSLRLTAEGIASCGADGSSRVGGDGRWRRHHGCRPTEQGGSQLPALQALRLPAAAGRTACGHSP